MKRKNDVKIYTGKPDVYTGEATGLRRDLSRSTKISQIKILILINF